MTVIVCITTSGDFSQEQIIAFKEYSELFAGSIQLFQEQHGYQGEEERKSKAIIRVVKDNYESFKSLLKKVTSDYDWKITIDQNTGKVLIEVKGYFGKDGKMPTETIKSIAEAISFIQNAIL